MLITAENDLERTIEIYILTIDIRKYFNKYFKEEFGFTPTQYRSNGSGETK